MTTTQFQLYYIGQSVPEQCGGGAPQSIASAWHGGLPNLALPDTTKLYHSAYPPILTHRFQGFTSRYKMGFFTFALCRLAIKVDLAADVSFSTSLFWYSLLVAGWCIWLVAQWIKRSLSFCQSVESPLRFLFFSTYLCFFSTPYYSFSFSIFFDFFLLLWMFWEFCVIKKHISTQVQPDLTCLTHDWAQCSFSFFFSFPSYFPCLLLALGFQALMMALEGVLKNTSFIHVCLFYRWRALFVFTGLKDIRVASRWLCIRYE